MWNSAGLVELRRCVVKKRSQRQRERELGELTAIATAKARVTETATIAEAAETAEEGVEHLGLGASLCVDFLELKERLRSLGLCGKAARSIVHKGIERRVAAPTRSA